MSLNPHTTERGRNYSNDCIAEEKIEVWREKLSDLSVSEELTKKVVGTVN